MSDIFQQLNQPAVFKLEYGWDMIKTEQEEAVEQEVEPIESRQETNLAQRVFSVPMRPSPFLRRNSDNPAVIGTLVFDEETTVDPYQSAMWMQQPQQPQSLGEETNSNSELAYEAANHGLVPLQSSDASNSGLGFSSLHKRKFSQFDENSMSPPTKFAKLE